MKNEKLLENLSKKYCAQLTTRRYNLADMISESYRLSYSCEEDSNLKKLVEAHIENVKSNPREVETLSQHLCVIKELARLEESKEIKDEVLTEAHTFKRPIRKTESCVSEEKVDEVDNPELTEEELDELTKHLEEIRKKKDNAPQKPQSAQEKEKESMDEASVMKDGKIDQERSAMKDNVNHVYEAYGTLANHFAGSCKKLIDISESLDYPKYMDVTTAEDSLAAIIKNTLDTTFIDMNNYIKSDVNESADVDKEVGDKVEKPTEEGDLVEEDAQDTVEPKEERVLDKCESCNESKEIGAVGAKVGDTIVDTKTGKEGKVQKLGQSGNYGLIYVDFGNGLRKINPMDDAQRFGRYTIKREDESCNESYRGLEEFAKKSSGKAFYKTFKKLDSKLHEGKALSREESIGLYKAANSALTQMSIELEHNPEFIGTFKESVSILSADVSRLLESLSNGKAPSKKNMMSLAKFSEALLNESEDLHNDGNYTVYRDDEGNLKARDRRTGEDVDFDKKELISTGRVKVNEAEDEDEEVEDEVAMDEVPAEEEAPAEEEVPADEETPEEDFVGDDEGDVQSEEAEAFDASYAEERVELHKELEAENADSEDPEVQEKIEADKEEVLNLDGITDEQVAELTGEEPESEEAPEEPEGEEITPDEESEEDPIEEPEDDSEITDDELEELKNHLKEMRSAKLKESAQRRVKNKSLIRY